MQIKNIINVKVPPNCKIKVLKLDCLGPINIDNYQNFNDLESFKNYFGNHELDKLNNIVKSTKTNFEEKYGICMDKYADPVILGSNIIPIFTYNYY